jgi:hypothetical protein
MGLAMWSNKLLGQTHCASDRSEPKCDVRRTPCAEYSARFRVLNRTSEHRKVHRRCQKRRCCV